MPMLDRMNIKRCAGTQGLKVLVWGLCVAGGTMMGIGLPGCSTDTCDDNRSALPLMGFYSSATGMQMMLDSIALGGVGAPGDSLLVEPGQSVLSVYLPFRFDSESTSFRIHYDYKEQGLDSPELDDVVTFHYTSIPYFASEECGAYYQYLIRDVEYTRHLIDSVAVPDSLVTNVEMERIRVYIRTSDSGGESRAVERRYEP